MLWKETNVMIEKERFVMLPDWLLNQSKRPSERVSFAAFKHWHKDSSLQTSGLLGPVRIIPSVVRKVEP